MTSERKRFNLRHLTGNTVWSLFGQLVPAAVGFLLVPHIISGLGDARFGLLSLAWAVVGYLSFLDLGISRAVTKSVATSLAMSRIDDLRTNVWSGIGLMVAIGTSAALLLYPLAPWASAHALAIPVDLRGEALFAVRLLCLGLPLTLLMNALRGVLEAYQRFALVNIVRLPFGVSTFVIPWITLGHTGSVAVVIGWLMVARLLAVIAYAMMCIAVMGEHARPQRPSPPAMRELLSFGAWITVSNVVGPLMVSFDRFIIGGLLSVSLVTYYVTPYQVATQFLILPTALSTVLFPVFASLWEQDRNRLNAIYADSLRLTFGIMLVAAVAIVAIAPQLLGIWLGQRFVGPSTAPLQWLMAGVMMNGVAQLSFTFIQSAGRSDWTAKLHLAEAPVYVLALVLSAKRYGLTGVAVVWCLRATADLLVLYSLAARIGLMSWRRRWVDAACLSAGGLALVIVAQPATVFVRGIIALSVVSVCLVAVYARIIAPARISMPAHPVEFNP